MGGYLILLGSRLGAPKPVLARMVLNVALDTIAGVVPVVGDLFDVAWKANTRNMALLERYLHPVRDGALPRKSPDDEVIDVTPVGTSWGCLLAIAFVLVAALLLTLVGFVAVAEWLLRAR